MAGTRLLIIAVTLFEVIALIGFTLYLTIGNSSSSCLSEEHYYVEYCIEHPSATLWNKVFPPPTTSSLATKDEMDFATARTPPRRRPTHIQFTLWQKEDVGVVVGKREHLEVGRAMNEYIVSPLMEKFGQEDFVTFDVSSRIGGTALFSATADYNKHLHHPDDWSVVPISSLSKLHFLLDDDSNTYDSSHTDIISIVIHVSSHPIRFHQKNNSNVNVDVKNVPLDTTTSARYRDQAVISLVQDTPISMQQAAPYLHHFLHQALLNQHHLLPSKSQQHSSLQHTYDNNHNNQFFQRSFIIDYAMGYYFPLLFPLVAPTLMTFLREYKRYRQKRLQSSSNR